MKEKNFNRSVDLGDLGIRENPANDNFDPFSLKNNFDDL